MNNYFGPKSRALFLIALSSILFQFSSSHFVCGADTDTHSVNSPESSASSVQKLCIDLSQNEITPPITAFISTNIDSQKAAITLNSRAKNEQIVVRQLNDSLDTQYFNHQLDKGDCILLNQNELRALNYTFDDRILPKENETIKEKLSRWKINLFGKYRKTEKKELYPIVLFRQRDQAKLYGYIEPSFLSRFHRDETHRESTTLSILKFNGHHHDLLILYVTCPPSREEVCHLKIKKDGKWVIDPKTRQVFSLPVLTRSKRMTDHPNISYRIAAVSDTPQGIYYLWASMFSENPIYGGVPRIDLDAAVPPINSQSYNINSYVLSELVPESSLNDYWINEWSLAYKLGRIFLRIHANSLEENDPFNYKTPTTELTFRATDGCINAGKNMMTLLDKLIDLKVFSKESIIKTDTANPNTLGWKVSNQLGKAFLILKDDDV